MIAKTDVHVSYGIPPANLVGGSSALARLVHAEKLNLPGSLSRYLMIGLDSRPKSHKTFKLSQKGYDNNKDVLEEAADL